MRDQYLPEVEGIIRANVPGAADATVLIFDHAIRTGGDVLQSDDEKYKQANPYGAGVHSDATVRSGHTRAKDQILGTNETEIKYGQLPASWGDVRPGREAQRRYFKPETIDHQSPEGEGGDHLIVNVWRPIVGPVTQWPLALLDARTVSQEDVHPTILNIYDNSPGGQSGNVAERGQDESELKVHDLDGNKLRYRIGEVLQPLPDPQHSWHVFPEFDVDECLLLKIFDSRRDGRTRFNAHCAVFDELGDPSAHRQSIEVRCLILLNNGQNKAKL